MDAVVQQILVQMISYFVVLILSIIVISLFQRGFFWKWLRARSSGGRLLLIKIKGVVKPIYKTGWIEENDLCFKMKWNDKIPKRIHNIKREYIYKDLGVSFVEIDDNLNCFLTPDLKGVTGFDAEKMNSLLLRALYRPSLLDPKDQIILIVVILLFFMSLIMIFYNYRIYKGIGEIKASIDYLTALFQNLNSTQIPRV
jgi:hypothetical protein